MGRSAKAPFTQSQSISHHAKSPWEKADRVHKIHSTVPLLMTVTPAHCQRLSVWPKPMADGCVKLGPGKMGITSGIKPKTSYVPTTPISPRSGKMPTCHGLSQGLVLWSFGALQSHCGHVGLELLAHLTPSAVSKDFPDNTANQQLGYFHPVLAVLAYLCV